MKTVIQNCETEFFLGEDSDWIPSRSDARTFKNSLSALSYCVDRNLKNVRIVLTFGPKEYDVFLPVLNEGRALAAH